MVRSKSCTYAPFGHMAVQMTLDRCGVVFMDRSQVRTAPGPQPQRGPPHVTDCGSGSPVTRRGQSRATGDQKLRLAHWNAEGVRQKKRELQNFLKQNDIDVCTIQETHLTENHRFYVRGYETYRHLQVFNIYSDPSPLPLPPLISPSPSTSFSPPQKTGSSWDTLTATLPAGDMIN